MAVKVVKNNYEMDKALIDDQYCVTSAEWQEGRVAVQGQQHNLWCLLKPCAAYNVYVAQKVIPAGKATYKLTKKKGFTRTFGASVGIKASVSFGILKCNASLELSAEYSYGETVGEETTEEFSQELTGPAVYNVYQPVILYANRVPFSQSAEEYLQSQLGQHSDVLRKGEFLYFFASVHRNSPRTVTTQINPISLHDLEKKMMDQHFSEWNVANPSKDYFYIKSCLTGGRVSLEWHHKVDEIQQNGTMIHMWNDEMLKDYEVFELEDNKYLKNVVTKKYVHARWEHNVEASKARGTLLHLWNGQSADQQFTLLADGRIRHAYSGNFWSIFWQSSASEMYRNGAKVNLWNSLIDDAGAKWERVSV